MFSDRQLVQRIAVYLKERRVEAGLTQKAVAEHFGYTTGQFVSNWERGLVMPPLSTVKELARLYRLDINDVVTVFCQETNRVIKEELLFGKSENSVANTANGFQLEAKRQDLLANS